MSSLAGVLNLNKPAGMTSRDVVNRVQRLVRPAKCGHAGTLDPMATGVLLVAIGPATRLISLLQQGQKTYQAEFTLGQTSDTDDSSGHITVLPPGFEVPDRGTVQVSLDRMKGRIVQVPPDFSAVHVDGQRAYSRARRGEELVLRGKDVDIHELKIHNYEWPCLCLEVVCGSGTYVRSIARDLGQTLGCGGLMSRLERTRIGPFSLESSIPVEDLSMDVITGAIVDPVAIVTDLPKYDCSDVEVRAILNGKAIPVLEGSVPTSSDQESVALTCDTGKRLVAMAILQSGFLQPKCVLMRTEPG